MTFAGAVPGPDGQPLDQIRITGVSATGHHGVLADERAVGQLFRADVVLHVDTRAAASADDLAETVSYADVAHDVHDVLAGPPVDLVETVAERIAAAVLAHAAVQAVDVRVHKPQAPIPVPFDDVEVAIRRDRVRTPVVAPPAFPSDAAGMIRNEESGTPAEESGLPESADDVATQVHDVAPVPVDRMNGAFVVPPTPVRAPEPTEISPPTAPAHEYAPEPQADPLGAAPDAPVDVVIALGGNVGDAQSTLRSAVVDIDRIPGVQVTEVSPLARTAAVGGPEQPDFLNAVLLARTTLSPRELLHACQAVEAQHGRVRQEHWGPRTLDVDIVQYGTLTASSEDLELPHPRARERAFVLVPWAEVAPHAVLVGFGGGPVAQLAATAPDRTGIRWLALDWLTDAAGSGRTPAAPAASSPGPEPMPAPAPQEQVSLQQAVPPPVPPTPPHGTRPPAMPPEPPHAAPPVHEPIPPAPELQLGQVVEPAFPTPDEQPLAPVPEPAFLVPDELPHPPISDVPLSPPAPLPTRPGADEPILLPPTPLPVRPVTGGPFEAPPVPQPFAPVNEGPLAMPPAPQPFPPVPDDPFPPATGHPFPPGPVPDVDDHR